MKLIALTAALIAVPVAAQVPDRAGVEARTIALAKSMTPEAGRPVLELAETVCPIVKQSGDVYLPQVVALQAHLSIRQTTFLIDVCTLYVMGVSEAELERAASQ